MQDAQTQKFVEVSKQFSELQVSKTQGRERRGLEEGEGRIFIPVEEIGGSGNIMMMQDWLATTPQAS